MTSVNLTSNFDALDFEKNLSAIANKDLEITYGRESYKVISILAASKSNLINRLFISDPIASSIVVSHPVGGDITQIIDFINGIPLDVSKVQSPLLLYEASIDLEIPAVMEILQGCVSKYLNRDNIFNLYQKAFEKNLDCTSIVNFFVRNFTEFYERNLFKRCNEDQIDLILRSPNLLLINNQVEFVINSVTNTKERPNSRLVKYLYHSPNFKNDKSFNLNRMRGELIRRFYNVPISYYINQ